MQTIQRMVAEEPLYSVKPARAGGGGAHKPLREAAAVVRDPNLEASTAILQELENEHEFLCARPPAYAAYLGTCMNGYSQVPVPLGGLLCSPELLCAPVLRSLPRVT